MSDKIARYNFGEFDGGLRQVSQKHETDVVYVNDLRTWLNDYLRDACDPGEKDAINKMLDLLK